MVKAVSIAIEDIELVAGQLIQLVVDGLWVKRFASLFVNVDIFFAENFC